MSPDITFIVCARNYERYVKEALDSCVNQLESGLYHEVICVDDGSNDGTSRIISDYGDTVKAYHTDSVGIERAFNLALSKSSGEYIVRVDADDALRRDFLKKIESYLAVSADIYYGDYCVIDEDSEVSHRISLPNFDRNEIIGRGDFLASGTIVKKTLFKQLRMYNTSVKNCGLENFELVCLALMGGYSFTHIPEHLFFYRRHANNLSRERRDSILSHGKELFLRLQLGDYSTGPMHPYFGTWV